MPHATGVEMDEIGSSVVSDPASFEGKRALPDLAGWYSGQTNINGLPGHMQAVFCHSGTAGSKKSVGFWRTIAGNDLKGAPVAEGALDIKKDIQQFRVNGVNFIGPEITEKMVYPVQSPGIVTAGTTIGNSEFFPGMSMIKMKCSIFKHCQASGRLLQAQTDHTKHD